MERLLPNIARVFHHWRSAIVAIPSASFGAMAAQAPTENRPGAENDIETLYDDKEPEQTVQEQRGTWGSKVEFVLACLGNMVGLGNVWRFPYLAYENGGGAFVIPYIAMIFLIGVPVLLLETSIGQFTAMGPVQAYANLAPLFQGLGVTCIITSALVSVYYNLILAWSLFYLYESVAGQNWANCDQWWNSEHCISIDEAIKNNSKITNESISSTKEFFDHYILQRSDSIEDISEPSTGLIASLAISWLLVVLALCKGVKSTGKVVYFTAIFPYVLLFILFIRGVTLTGAGEGLKYYLKPDFAKIGDANVWRTAIVQVFFSVGGGVGIMITYGSYNRFHNSLVRDTLFLVIGDLLTSLFAGAVIFSMIGFVAHVYNRPVSAVLGVGGGTGLAFIVMPDGLSQMPWPVLWAALFFFMLFLLGIDSSFGYVENITSFMFDYIRSKGAKVNKPLIVTCTGFTFFMAGLIMTTSAGIYFFNILDYFATGIPVIFIGFMECIVVSHVYGMENYFNDMKYMTGWTPSSKTRAHVSVSLWTVSPILLALVVLVDLISLIKGSVNGNVDGIPQPWWALLFGWSVCIGPLLAIPIGMILYVKNYKSTVGKKRTTCQIIKRGLNHTKVYKKNAAQSGNYASSEEFAKEEAKKEAKEEAKKEAKEAAKQEQSAEAQKTEPPKTSENG